MQTGPSSPLPRLRWLAGTGMCLLLVLGWRELRDAGWLEAQGSARPALAQTRPLALHLPLLLRAERIAPTRQRPLRTPPPASLTPPPLPSATMTKLPEPEQAFGSVRLAPDFQLEGRGDIVDSLAFWEAEDPVDSLLLATAKGNQVVEVWRAPFLDGELDPLVHAGFMAGGAVNGITVDQRADVAYIAVSQPTSSVLVFDLPGLGFQRELVSAEVSLRAEPNLAHMRLAGGESRLYVSADQRVYIYDSESGRQLSDFAPGPQIETLLADPFHQALYVPDETGGSGVYAFDPDGEALEQAGTNRFGGQGEFDADAEGIALYRCLREGGEDSGTGWLIVSDQKSGISDFEVFDRQDWAHLGRLQLEGVAFSDGIASMQQALPQHPLGVFAAVDDDRSIAIIGWDRIFEATGMSCDG